MTVVYDLFFFSNSKSGLLLIVICRLLLSVVHGERLISAHQGSDALCTCAGALFLAKTKMLYGPSTFSDKSQLHANQL